VSSTLPSEALNARRRFVTEAPVARVLWLLMVPASVWYLLSYSFFVADAYFVGQLGTEKLAVMGLVVTVVMLSLTLAQGIGAALASIAPFMLGRGEHGGVARLVFHALLLGATIALLLLLIAPPLTDPLFAILGANESMRADAKLYMDIWFMGFGFAVAGVVGQSALRASGDVATPALILLCTGVLNVALDPVLIFGLGPVPALGLKGAAIAAVVARAVGASATLWIVARRDRLLSFSGLKLVELGASWSRLAKIALPVTLQMVSFGLVAAATLRIAGSLGAPSVAALGVGNRIEAILAALVFGLPMILPTFIGQNAGAGKTSRVGQGALLGARQVALAQLVIGILAAAFAPWLARPFSDDDAVRSLIQTFAWYAPLSYIGYALTGTAAAVFMTLGRMGSYLALTVLPTLPAVALAWLGARTFGFVGLLCAMSFVRIAVGLIAWFWVRSFLRTNGYLRHEPAAPSALAEAQVIQASSAL
jgi:putative MATE family efflux protein